MKDDSGISKKRPIGKIIAGLIIIVLSGAGIFLYYNFNRLLSEALMKAFNANLVSNVYELNFEKLQVNIFTGSVSVSRVAMHPREVPLKIYPYINSSFQLTTERIMLLNVDLVEFLKSGKINLKKVEILKPDIQVLVGDNKPILFPFRDTVQVADVPSDKVKKPIESFTLNEFQLIDASFKIINSAKQREFDIKQFTISLYDILIHQEPGRDLVSLKRVDVSMKEFEGAMKSGGVKSISLENFSIGIDSLKIQNSVDSLAFQVDDAKAELNGLDIQTADSLFHLTMKSFNFSYKNKSIQFDSLAFKSNISDAAMQRRFKFQHTQVSGTVGSIILKQLNVDSLVFHRSLFIENIMVDNPSISIFKDNLKPVDKNRFPQYFGQQIGAIPIPLRIKQVTVTNVNLLNVERKRDSSYAKVSIGRGTVVVKNITNLSKNTFLTMDADAIIADKVRFGARLEFSYQKPQFNVSGKFEKFNLPDLNPVIQAYTPAKINKGIADEISFSNTVTWTDVSGTMKFLYHDLDVDLDLKNQAKWKSSVLAFAANAIVNASNPGSSDLPPRIVHLHANRDMNKGFVNIIIKSILNGVKETMMMSKENKKSYKAAKDKAKQEKKAK